VIGGPARADAALDRVVPSACLITRSGESMRKQKTKQLTATAAID
jgi:hypothetical protein